MSLWDVEPDEKLETLMAVLDELEPGRTTLLVMHLGIDGPEMAALIAERGIRLVNYRDLKERHGLDSMRRPASAGYSMNSEDEP